MEFLKKLGIFILITIFFLFIIFILQLFYFIGPGKTIYQALTSKEISGLIYDCATNKPISGAKVSIFGVGWGFRGNHLVWDKGYNQVDYSDLNGKYFITYKIGTSISVVKEGYLDAYYYSRGGKGVDIGLLNSDSVADPSERTYQCKLHSECLKSEVRNGVKTSWDSCANPTL